MKDLDDTSDMTKHTMVPKNAKEALNRLMEGNERFIPFCSPKINPCLSLAHLHFSKSV